MNSSFTVKISPNLFAAVLRFTLKSPETETRSTYPQQLVYPKFIVLLKPRLNCKKSFKNQIEIFLWCYCIPGTIPSPLLNCLIITPQSYEVQIIIIIVQMKKNWGQELSGYSSKLLSMNMSPHNMEAKCLSVNFMTIQSSQLKII